MNINFVPSGPIKQQRSYIKSQTAGKINKNNSYKNNRELAEIVQTLGVSMTLRKIRSW
jgi:hypothetical protein